ncbi:hypothetical protein DB31_1293 [Hyalangium minutum]|uniref:Uncharacterized protein n=1 Tax=Hyalangium minutum TaxID=394096 RepID=A0A085WEW5_9BACT|nr:hypothetical protein DB31_1293 [Hyalangium minutum]
MKMKRAAMGRLWSPSRGRPWPLQGGLVRSAEEGALMSSSVEN